MSVDPIVTAPAPVDDTGVGATIVQVAEDARAYAAAQVDLYKAIAFARLDAAKWGLVLGIVVVILAIAAIGGLVVGAILTLATLVGPGWATVIVVGVVLLVAAIFGMLAAKRLSRAFGAMS